MKSIYTILLFLTSLLVNAQIDQSFTKAESCYSDYYITNSISYLNCEKFEHGNYVLIYEEQFENDDFKNLWKDRQPWGTMTGSLGYIQPENVFIDNGVLKISIEDEPGEYLNQLARKCFPSVYNTLNYYIIRANW